VRLGTPVAPSSEHTNDHARPRKNCAARNSREAAAHGTWVASNRVMPKTVEEIMNQEVFALRPDESAERALEYILFLGITGAPVTDRDQRVIGHASFRDLLSSTKGSLVAERMTTPVEVVSPGTTIDEAGRRMARLRVHRLIVTEESRAVGVVSALDVVSALLGVPVVHPSTFAHFDRSAGATWTDQADLTVDAVPLAPDGPGVFVLIEGAPLKRDWIVWIESSANVRTRLYDLLSTPQDDRLLARLLEHPGELRFRAAAAPDEGERARLVAHLKERAARWPGSAFYCETEPAVARPPLQSIE
jgi:CBS domain-containing protein